MPKPDLLNITSRTSNVLFNPQTTPDKKIQQGINAAMELFNYFSNASEEARNRVNDNQNTANTINNSIRTQTEINNAAIEQVLQQIESNKDKITDIMDQIDGLEAEKEAINAKIVKSQEIIDENIEKFKNGNAQEKREALDAISKEGENIRSYIEEAQALLDSQDGLNEDIEDINTDNEELNDNADEIREDGEERIGALEEQSRINNAETIALEAEEPIHDANGVRLEAEAEALEASGGVASIFSFGVGSVAASAEAAKLRMQAQQEFAAAGIIGAGVPGIFQTITGSVQLSNEGLNYIQNTFIAIGTEYNDANGLSFDFFDSSNALGSGLEDMLAVLTPGADNLETAIEEANQDIENEDKNNDEEKEKDKDEFNFEANALDIA